MAGAPFLTAQHYHEQAQTLRKLAAAEENILQRRSLIEIADNYDQLCATLMKAARKAADPHRL